MDHAEKKRLCMREQARRRALWGMGRFEPGQSGAIVLLHMLDQIEREDLVDPIGDFYASTPSDLSSLVPINKLNGRLDYVFENDIPEPWRERFIQASLGSTKPLDGWFARDWLKFLNLWQAEMNHLAMHRKTRESVPASHTDQEEADHQA
jgi:hypothetical protein